MASFEDLSFDWSTLCQECPECWTASVIWTVLTMSISQHKTANVLPRPVKKYIYGYLCGSNFENYATRILFWQAQKRKPALYVLHEGKCRKICQIYAPVCASNGLTYHNECQLEYARKKDRRLHVKYKGICAPKQILSKASNDKEKLFHVDYFFGITEKNPFSRKCILHC